MSSSSSSRLSKINIPRLVLWLASIVIAVLGYVLMASSNSNEADIYTAGKADYPKLFAAQSGSTIGGLLIAVGVLGALLALTSLAVTWRPAATPEVAVRDTSVLDSVESDRDERAETPVAENATGSEAATPRYVQPKS